MRLNQSHMPRRLVVLMPMTSLRVWVCCRGNSTLSRCQLMFTAGPPEEASEKVADFLHHEGKKLWAYASNKDLTKTQNFGAKISV